MFSFLVDNVRLRARNTDLERRVARLQQELAEAKQELAEAKQNFAPVTFGEPAARVPIFLLWQRGEQPVPNRYTTHMDKAQAWVTAGHVARLTHGWQLKDGRILLRDPAMTDFPIARIFKGPIPPSSPELDKG